MMDILWKSVVGALMTALIAWLAKKGNTLPGIIPLFPTFGLIALYLVGVKGDPAGFRQVCVASMKTIPAYLAFVGVCYLVGEKTDFRIALVLGLGVWFVAALAVFLVPRSLLGRI